MATNDSGFWGPLPPHGEEIFPCDVEAMSAAKDGQETFLSDIRCQRLNMPVERAVATDVACGDPAANTALYVAHASPFVEVLLDRLCRDGQAATS